MHTLAQLRAGSLAGITRLDLSDGLTEFPREIFDLADSLEVLNLSDNAWSSLPEDLHRLTRLRVLFCWIISSPSCPLAWANVRR